MPQRCYVCHIFGEECGADQPCCGGDGSVCSNSTRGTCCWPLGHGCSPAGTHDGCCVGLPCDSSGACARCKDFGVSCSSDAECCPEHTDLHCLTGACRLTCPKTCVVTSGPCKGNAGTPQCDRFGRYTGICRPPSSGCGGTPDAGPPDTGGCVPTGTQGCTTDSNCCDFSSHAFCDHTPGIDICRCPGVGEPCGPAHQCCGTENPADPSALLCGTVAGETTAGVCTIQCGTDKRPAIGPDGKILAGCDGDANCCIGYFCGGAVAGCKKKP